RTSWGRAPRARHASAATVTRSRCRMLMAAKISLLLLAQNAPYLDSIPGTLVRFEMMPVPGDRPFWIGKTEVTWDEYDVWAFRLDLTPQERSSGVDATARPSPADVRLERDRSAIPEEPLVARRCPVRRLPHRP